MKLESSIRGVFTYNINYRPQENSNHLFMHRLYQKSNDQMISYQIHTPRKYLIRNITLINL
jgi:hypothetical protein